MNNFKFRLITSEPQNGFMNMAIDEAIAIACDKQLSPPTLRLYTWNPPCISVGYFQNVDEIVDISECKRQSINIVRRLTGGKAVLHNKELTYSIISPSKNDIFPNGIKGSYKAIADCLLHGIKNLGISGEITERPSKKENGFSCFLDTSFYEISVKGKKLIGSAQKRWKNLFLQHGSIIISPSHIQLASLLRFNKEEERTSFVNLHKEKSTSIEEETKTSSDIIEIKSAIKKGFEEKTGIKLFEAELTDFEKTEAQRLLKEKYENDNWNLKRETF
ncbi:MAG: lipoate--protein ligase family protein [Nitrospirota bacterium]